MMEFSATDQQNCVLYSATDSISDDKQIEICREYCKRLDLNIVEEFRDVRKGVGEYGAIDRLFHLILDKSDISFIVISTLDSLTKSLSKTRLLKYLQALSIQPIQIVCVDDGPCIHKIQVLSQLISSLDSNNERGAKISQAMKARAKNGEWMGTLPPGYIRVSLKQIEFRPDGKISTVIHEALIMRLDPAMSNEEILAQCHTRGYKITMENLMSIFFNPFYAGMIQTKATDGKMEVGKQKGLISLSQHEEIKKILKLKGFSKRA